MQRNSTDTPYHSQPDEAFWTTAPASAASIEFVTTQPADDPDFAPKYTGRFKKGHDPRRHQFTPEECSAGFWAAIESIITRYPNAIDSSGRHIACSFLKRKSRNVEVF